MIHVAMGRNESNVKKKNQAIKNTYTHHFDLSHRTVEVITLRKVANMTYRERFRGWKLI